MAFSDRIYKFRKEKRQQNMVQRKEMQSSIGFISFDDHISILQLNRRFHSFGIGNEKSKREYGEISHESNSIETIDKRIVSKCGNTACLQQK